MIKNIVEKDIKTSIKKWCEIKGVSKVSLMVGLEDKKFIDNDNYSPFYFLKLDNRIQYKRNEESIVIKSEKGNAVFETYPFKELMFIKIDMMQKGAIVGSFLKGEIKRYAKNNDINPTSVYCEIRLSNDDNIIIDVWNNHQMQGVWHDFKLIEKTTLDKVLMEDIVSPTN